MNGHLLRRFNYILVHRELWKGAYLLSRDNSKRIAVSAEIYEILKRNAKETNRSLKEYVEYLVNIEKAADPK
jgi:hypothetical protein